MKLQFSSLFICFWFFFSCSENDNSNIIYSEKYDDIIIEDTINYNIKSLNHIGDTISVLSIGNSFSSDAVEHHLVDIAKVLMVGNLSYSAAGLDFHWQNVTNNKSNYVYFRSDKGYKSNVSINSAIRDYSWDYISLQQVSSLSGIASSFSPYLENLIDYIKENRVNKNGKIILHQTWAYAPNSKHPGFINYKNNQFLMFKSIIESYNYWERYKDIDMRIPCGTAIQNARTTSFGQDLTIDGYHLDQRVGQYLAALTWYDKLTYNNVVGNKYVPNNVSEKEIITLQKSAHAAVINPNNITIINN